MPAATTAMLVGSVDHGDDSAAASDTGAVAAPLGAVTGTAWGAQWQAAAADVQWLLAGVTKRALARWVAIAGDYWRGRGCEACCLVTCFCRSIWCNIYGGKNWDP